MIVIQNAYSLTLTQVDYRMNFMKCAFFDVIWRETSIYVLLDVNYGYMVT